MGLLKKTKEETTDKTVITGEIKIRNLKVKEQTNWENIWTVCTTEKKKKKEIA